MAIIKCIPIALAELVSLAMGVSISFPACHNKVSVSNSSITNTIYGKNL